MSIVAHFGLFVLGLIVLAVGAEIFIRGAVRVARRLGVSPFVIGLTLVGFGTSTPELVVNVSAALGGNTELAIGNVVGSNIANVGLILGTAAVIRALVAQMRLLKVEVPVVIVASVAFWVMGFDGEVDRTDGTVLLVGFTVLMTYIVRAARREPPAVKEEFGTAVPPPAGWFGSLLMLAFGLAGLVGGAELMVRSAVAVATAWGVGQLVIGMTIVAVGTSLPELASSLVAAYRGESDIAIGNVVGSNCFNILFIIGVTSIITPLPVTPAVTRGEMPVMIGFAVLLPLLIVRGMRVRRWHGALLLALYAGFIAWQVAQAQS